MNAGAIAVLREIGIDISRQRSKSLAEFEGESFDCVITLGGSANERCSLFFGGVKRIHIGFDDPAKASGSEGEIMAEFRSVRDEIKKTSLDFFANV